MSLSREQLSSRRAGITATDMAAIVGVHPYRKPIDVFLDKTGAGAAFEGNLKSKWGEILEEPIRTDYEQRHDVRVEVPGTLHHGERQWVLATPDGIVYPVGSRSPDRGLEIKVHSRDAVFYGQLEYGAAGTDEVPAHELVQCVWGMIATGLLRWDLVAFIDGAPMEFTIERDQEMVDMLLEAGEKFRRDHIETNTPPPPDGSAAYGAWQKRKWAGRELNPDVLDLDADHPLRDTIIQLRETRAAIAELELRRDRHNQTIKEVIGDRTTIRWHDERGKKSTINWKRNRDRTITDWEAVARSAQQRAAVALSAHQQKLVQALLVLKQFETDEAVEEVAEALRDTVLTLGSIASAEIQAEHTTTTAGNRPLTVPRHWAKNETDKPHHEG